LLLLIATLPPCQCGYHFPYRIHLLCAEDDEGRRRAERFAIPSPQVVTSLSDGENRQTATGRRCRAANSLG
jgi:hypothetical protein